MWLAQTGLRESFTEYKYVKLKYVLNSLKLDFLYSSCVSLYLKLTLCIFEYMPCLSKLCAVQLRTITKLEVNM